MLSKETERLLHREYSKALTKTFSDLLPKRDKSGVVTSTLGPDGSDFVRKAYAASLLDEDALAEKLAEAEAKMKAPATTKNRRRSLTIGAS